MFLEGRASFVTNEAGEPLCPGSTEGLALFNGLERQVIALGQHDGRLSIMKREGLRWTFVSLLAEPALGLANVRLEALRQLVVALRFSPAGAVGGILERAIGAGLTSQQIAAIVVMTDATRRDRFQRIPIWIQGTAPPAIRAAALTDEASR